MSSMRAHQPAEPGRPHRWEVELEQAHAEAMDPVTFRQLATGLWLVSRAIAGVPVPPWLTLGILHAMREGEALAEEEEEEPTPGPET
jgi:hypothetical protein